MSQTQGAIKWALYMLALLVVGPLAAQPIAALRDASGGHDATVLVGASLRAGLLAGVLPILAASVIGLVGARLVGPRHAMLAAGLVMSWAAWRSASVDGLMRASPDPSAMLPLAAEGALLGLSGVVLASVIWIAGTPPAGAHAAPAPPPRARPIVATGRLIASGLSGVGVVGIGTGLIAGAIVAWLVAIEPLKGQTIFAAMLAGIAAGGFSRATASRDEPASPVPALIAMSLLATLAPISALVMTGSTRIASAAVGGDLFALAHVMPMDWLAGALWGVPMGLAWAESMIEKPAERGDRTAPDTSRPGAASNR